MLRPIPALLGVLLLASCGGGGDSVAPPPPPPFAAPASLSLVAGDGQSGAPGAPVSVKPSVRVRDAQGRALPGVAVAFAVEAGGGSVQQPSATTGADGTASPGDWTLGPSEGENRLRASVGSLPPLLITAQGVFQQVRLADTTIGAGGGIVTYHKAGDPLDGLELTIPARAYSGASHWSITARPVQAAPSLRFGQAVGSVLEITGDQSGYSDSLLVLRIPHARNPAEFAMAFAWDPATGRLEGLPTGGETASALYVVTRHFNPALLAKRAGVAGAPSAASVGATVGGLYVIIVTANFSALAQPATTGFRPGVDDWEFVNWGSYMEPGGHCAGQSISAMWYYLRERSQGATPLYGLFDTVPGFWPDDPRGIHLATWTQGWLDFYPIWQSERQMDAIAQRNGVPLDRLYYYSTVVALRVTGEPHFVEVRAIDQQGNDKGGHALVAYASDPGKIWVADPNYPGQQRGIVFVNDQLGPYPSQLNAGSSGFNFNKISFIGQSAIVPVTLLDNAWGAVQQGTLVNGWFPDYRLEYRDTLTSAWRALTDTLTTYLGDLAVRTICPGCRGQLPGGPAKQQPIWVVDANGGDIGSVPSTGVNGATVPLPGGPKRFGAVVLGIHLDPDPDALPVSYVDFRWINVKALRFSVTPAQTFAPSGTTVDFVAHPMGGAPPGAHYLWDFGDGSAILDKVSDTTASHKYTADGFYLPKVSLANGRKFAEATANVQIGATLRIDPNPANTPVNTPLTLTARNLATGAPAPMRYIWDFGDNTTLQRDGDSTAQHSWATAGSYTVTVSMKDPVTQVERGRGSGQVQVGFALSQISVGGYFACGLTAAGAAWCWGQNQFGQVGDGASGTPRLRPVPVTGGHLFSQISAGFEHACGVTPTGELWCWGRNQWGRLGIGTVDNVPHPQPIQVPGLPPIAYVTAGLEYTCALDVAGQAWCWGRADDGQLGEGTTGDNLQRSSPVRVLGALSFAQLEAGSERTCGVTGPGLAYCWGYNGGPRNNSSGTYPAGVLGVGSIASFVPQPAQVSGSTLWAEVSASTGFSCGRTTTGALRCWGINGYAADEFYAGRGGQLGDGTTTPSIQPVPTATGTLSFTGVATGGVSACALSAVGEAWCWGTNAAGEVGDGGPTTVPASSHYPTPIKVVGGHVFASLSVGWASACGITPAGETWCWGGNFYGGLGDGTTLNRSTPVRVSP